MNKNSNRTKNSLRTAVLLALVFAFSIAHAQVVVQLRVNDNEDKLIINTPGNCKKQPNPPGCISATRGASHINFNLVGNKTCTASGNNWELDSVVLSMRENGAPGNLTDAAASDFNADKATGVVNPRNINANQIGIQNNNSAMYDIWYTVKASCVGGGSPIDTDPRVENDGTGSM